MKSGTRTVLLSADASNDPENGAGMEFRLTYAGPLYATQRDPVPGQRPKHTENRHHIRRVFHEQMKRLWREPPLLQSQGPAFLMTPVPNFSPPAITCDEIAKKHAMYGFNFVPVVTEELDLLCGLDILFLRPDRPGDLIWAGDIDNRLKTLFDALRVPEPGEGYVERTPASDEEPFFVLLEDDKLISKITVETDRLLEPVDGSTDQSHVRLVITVRIRPHELSVYNMHYG